MNTAYSLFYTKKHNHCFLALVMLSYFKVKKKTSPSEKTKQKNFELLPPEVFIKLLPHHSQFSVMQSRTDSPSPFIIPFVERRL